MIAAGSARRHSAGLYLFMLAAAAGAFAAGLFEPELRAQGGLPETWLSLRPRGEAGELDPVQAHNYAARVIRTRFLDTPPPGRKLTYRAIRGMLQVLDDPYTRFLEPGDYQRLRMENEGEFEGIGAELESEPDSKGRIRVIRPMPGGPAARAGMKRGDLITHVDGKSIAGLTVDQAIELIRGEANTTVRLTVVRAGSPKPIVLTIRRQPVEIEVVQSRMLEGQIGYVFLSQFNELADRRLEAAVRSLEAQRMKALILDLRGNPGGLLEAAIDVASRFLPRGKSVVQIVERGERQIRCTNDRLARLNDSWPMAVLINRTSASASEIVAGAIKDHGAGLILGTTSFGKGLVQTVIPLEDGSACMITTSKYLTPSGRDINRSREQRGGVTPHVEVQITEEQFNQNQDVQLERALAHLHTQTGYRRRASRR